MLKNVNTVTNIAASSIVNDVLVMTMRATIDGSTETWNISKSIRNSELYIANQAECDADYAEFEARVIELTQ